MRPMVVNYAIRSSLAASWVHPLKAALLACVLAALMTPRPILAQDLKVATWNLDWLTTRPASARYLPPDVTVRQDAEMARLAAYARELNADVIALEEVDNHEAVATLFPPDAYSVHMTRDHVMQRVGIAVRRGIPYDIHPDLTALAQEHLRSGADITLHLRNHDLRLLAVHLKKGCSHRSLTRTPSGACRELAAQIDPLRQWIRDRTHANEAFLILGDFNRWMDGRDPFLQSLNSAAPLARATEGHSSPCWGGENFIDHILAGGPAITWMQPDSLKVLVYRETDPSLKDRLSDHCPVSVQIVVPE
ncbi:endonuclease/exonuclease/phosphatase family protein [Rhodopila sp.]|uniref:endonuclease/exonuclease/phosphatase family protein n=1 Tax=Rhodopila sp. TaxID=2480087 RepID=UPI002D7E97FD|nr:endonuclease/exonuclease/phosphatase family protein [Rhodopila sp.]